MHCAPSSLSLPFLFFPRVQVQLVPSFSVCAKLELRLPVSAPYALPHAAWISSPAYTDSASSPDSNVGTPGSYHPSKASNHSDSHSNSNGNGSDVASTGAPWLRPNLAIACASVLHLVESSQGTARVVKEVDVAEGVLGMSWLRVPAVRTHIPSPPNHPVIPFHKKHRLHSLHLYVITSVSPCSSIIDLMSSTSDLRVQILGPRACIPKFFR